MLKYITIISTVGLAFAGLYILLLRSENELVSKERDYLQASLSANMQFIANDTKRRQNNELETQKHLVNLANDQNPNAPVGPKLSGVIERLPVPSAKPAP